jgi:hypothetical protein
VVVCGEGEGCCTAIRILHMGHGLLERGLVINQGENCYVCDFTEELCFTYVPDSIESGWITCECA